MNGFHYTGKGRHFGIPARDLTHDEYEALTPGQQRVVRESVAYRGKGGKPAADTPSSSSASSKPADGKEGR